MSSAQWCSKMKQDLKLESRTCKCGCGKTFLTMPTSKQEYWARSHDEKASGREESERSHRELLANEPAL